MSVKDNGLEVSADFLDEPFFMLPESDTTFFDKADGERFNFKLNEGLVVGFTVGRFEASKM